MLNSWKNKSLEEANIWKVSWHLDIYGGHDPEDYQHRVGTQKLI